MPRPRITLDLGEVERLAANGLTHAEIAQALGVSRHTIMRRKRTEASFATAIKRGELTAKIRIAGKLLELCEAGNLGAIIWYEKTRCGYSDKRQIQQTTQPIRIVYDNDPMAHNGTP
jgi:hypothetical protein